MSAERFTLDTNILIYVIDANAGVKQQLAVEILKRAADRDCRLTLQSMSEFYSAVTRKTIMRPDEAAAQVEDWLTLFPTIAVTPRSIRAAMAHAAAGRTSYWDGLLVETAVDGGCSIVITEDMADGAVIGGAAIRNPFSRGSLSSAVELVLS